MSIINIHTSAVAYEFNIYTFFLIYSLYKLYVSRLARLRLDVTTAPYIHTHNNRKIKRRSRHVGIRFPFFLSSKYNYYRVFLLFYNKIIIHLAIHFYRRDKNRDNHLTHEFEVAWLLIYTWRFFVPRGTDNSNFKIKPSRAFRALKYIRATTLERHRSAVVVQPCDFPERMYNYYTVAASACPCEITCNSSMSPRAMRVDW